MVAHDDRVAGRRRSQRPSMDGARERPLAAPQKCPTVRRYLAAIPPRRDSTPQATACRSRFLRDDRQGMEVKRGAAMAKKKKKNSWLKNLQGLTAAVIAAIPLVVPAIVAAVASVANTMELRDGNQARKRSDGKNGSSKQSTSSRRSSSRTKKASARA